MSQSIPLVDLKAQYRAIQPQIDAAIQGVIQSTSFIMGPDVKKFEDAYAQYCRADHCIGVSSGTSAIELVLRACNIGPGDEVITISHTFVATIEAIYAVGARPVFVDVDAQTYNMDADKVAAAISPATRAIMPVHIYGQPADMTQLRAVADAHDLLLIEDAAQAHGATWMGQRTGTLADAACFSFYPGKNLGAYGDAGAVVTQRAEIAQRVRLMRNHGRTDKYLHETLGFGERMDTMQAAILAAKLPHLDAWTAARRRLAARYDELLATEVDPSESDQTKVQNNSLILPSVDPNAEPAWHLYVLRTRARDELIAHLRADGIGAGIHYPIPLHLQPGYSELGYNKGDFPVTEEVADTCLSLPIFPEMSDEQQDRVVDSIRHFLQKQRR